MSPRRRRDSSQSSLSGSVSLFLRRDLEDRVMQLEYFKDVTKKKEKEKYKWGRTGCKKQHVFNSDVREIYSDKLRAELKASYGCSDGDIGSHCSNRISAPNDVIGILAPNAVT